MAQDDWFSQGTTSAAPTPQRGGGWITDPFKVNAEARADRSADRQDAAALRAAEAAARSASSAEVSAAKTQQEIGDRGNNRTDKLRDDFRALPAVKEYSAALASLMAGLKSKPDGAGDNALIYAYAKAMDPGSVVRESEMGMASSTGSFIESTVAGLKKQLGIEGGGQLSPETRANLRREMNTKVAQLAKAYGVARADFQDSAKRQGVNPADVVGRSPADGYVSEYKQIMGDKLRDQPQAIATTQAQEIDPTGANAKLSPQDRDFISANARYMTPESMKQWYADKGMSISDKEASDTYAYYQKGGQQNAAVNVPQGEASRLGATAAGPVGAYFSGAFNGALPGMTDEVAGGISAMMGGDYTASRDAFDQRKKAVADANPVASTIGNVSGGLAAIAAPGAALSRLGVGGAAGAATFAPRLLAEDALYGGIYGAGENNDNRLTGGLTGALEGAGGGVAGRAAVRGAGMAFRGARGQVADASRYLREQGVPLTIPQMVGGRLKSYEDRLSGFQGIGNRIADARRNGLDAMNSAAFRQGLEPVGQIPPGVIGEQAVEAAEGVIDAGYRRALDGRTFDANEPQFLTDIGASLRDARALPQPTGDQAAFGIQRSMEPFVSPTGQLDGRGMQQITQELARRSARFSRSQDAVGPDAADILSGARDAVGGMVERQAPEAFEQFTAANTAFRNSKILEDAVGSARNVGLGTFTPAQLNNAAYANARRFGGRQSTTDRPFFELTRAAQEVLPSTVPDSGTAGRAATSIWRDTARDIAHAPLYSDAVTRAVAPLLLDRTPEMIRIGEAIERRARIPGMFGNTLALQYGQ